MKTPEYSYIYRGESMTPTLRPGDLIICRPPRPEQIRPGDIIVYARPGDANLTVHRVVKKTVQGFRTQGDHVPLTDPWLVASDWIRGVCCRVERRGRTFRIFGGPVGLFYAGLLPWRIKLSTRLRSGTRPLYHRLCYHVLWKGRRTHWINAQIASYQRADGTEWKLLWKGREIGRLAAGKSAWQIRKPYLLLINEALLPRRDAP